LGATRAPRRCGFETPSGLWVLATVTLPIALALAGGSPGGASAAGSQTAPRVPGELIVGFEAGATQSAQNDAVAQAGGTRATAFPQIRAVLIKVPAQLAERATKYLLGHPRVRYVEPNHVVQTVATTPNDPSFSQLWGLSNTGQTGGTPDADIDAPEAWDVTTGSSDVVVGVTDTGVDFGHQDLAQQQWVNAGENCGSMDPTVVCDDRSDGVDDDGNSYVDDWRGWDFVNDDNNPFDDHRHGTHVAGTIGAVGDNGVGVVGVNWNVRIMALKILDAAGSGTTADAISATLYSADRGAHISSNSWGGGPVDQSLLDAIEYGAARNMLFVAAAGNDGRSNDTTPFYPANYGSEAIVSVAATDHNDALAFFSNYGASTVDLGAPGVNILATTPGNTYQSFSGTSMATPHVSGVAALLRARFPNASLYGLKALLLRSVDPVGSLAGRTATGGRLNAFTAVSCDTDPKVWLESPASGFVAGVGDQLAVGVLASNCAAPAGLGNVSVTVNGTPVALQASTPDGLYEGTYTVPAAGALTVTASVGAGGDTATQTVTGQAFQSYTCQDVPMSWVDVTPGTRLSGASGGDDSFSTLGIGFPISFFGQTYSTAYVSSNGFLSLTSSSGANAHLNAAIPNTAAPNGIFAPFWDDLNPPAGGGVYAGVTGAAPNRTLHVEWYNVPHFSLSGSGTVTVEMSLEEDGDVRYQYLDTDFGNPTWNNGASATAGVERADGVAGKQVSHATPALTSGRAVRCTYGAPAPPPPPLAVTTTSLPEGTVGEAYSETLAATGGTPPYTWSVDSGSWPPGVSLAPGTGVVSGTPTAAGTYDLTVRVTDAGTPGQSVTRALTLAVAPPPVPPLEITTTGLLGGTVGEPYSQTLQLTGGTSPYTWSLASGALPDGLALDASTGAVNGTPTTSGSSAFTARVTDSDGRSDTQALSIAVAPPPPTITTTSLPGGAVGVAYSQTLQATGGAPPNTWSLESGALPAGLALNASTGEISGTPTTSGTSSFTAEVTDVAGRSDTQVLAIAVTGTTTVTASPTSTAVDTGTHRAGTADDLVADDNAYYEVNSTSSGAKTAAWYGSFAGVTNSLSNLRVSYTGKNSRSCTQTVSLWRWSSSSWVTLDSRTVGTTEVVLADLVPSGTLANYVSGTTGDGEVRVRIRCRTSSGPGAFFSSGDLLKISYVRP
jgi:subtilisin family serine protease